MGKEQARQPVQSGAIHRFQYVSSRHASGAKSRCVALWLRCVVAALAGCADPGAASKPIPAPADSADGTGSDVAGQVDTQAVAETTSATDASAPVTDASEVGGPDDGNGAEVASTDAEGLADLDTAMLDTAKADTDELDTAAADTTAVDTGTGESDTQTPDTQSTDTVLTEVLVDSGGSADTVPEADGAVPLDVAGADGVDQTDAAVPTDAMDVGLDSGAGCVDGPGCPCTSTTDCTALEDGDLCNGTLYCDKSAANPVCKVNPVTVVTCLEVPEQCELIACDPASGTCKTSILPDGTPCSDNNASTVGDTCQNGQCGPGTAIGQCGQDSDCSKWEDGDWCNGTLFCNKATQQCQLNPSTVVVCPTVDDTTCLQSQCQPVSGTCQLVPTAEKLPCDDGNPCTADEACVTGVCTPSADICICLSDADCTQQDDGDLCNGTLYCDLSSGKCKFNPATVVSCPSVLDTPCSHNTCQPLSGDCTMVTLADGAPCDDGNQCTVGEACTSGSCSGTSTCTCLADSDCATQEDGNLCNGVLYCNKQSGTCVINPATVKVCPTAGDSACSATVCAPSTGACEQDLAYTGAPCDADGNPCTKNDFCDSGQCKPGNNICECLVDGDCAGKNGDNKCISSMYCDLTTYSCQPAQQVSCDTSLDTVCRTTACSPLTGKCVQTTLPDDTLCGEGGLCSGLLLCQDGDCTAGPPVSCSDANDCTLDTCEPAQGCTFTALTSSIGAPVLCSDGSVCTSGDACSDGQCVGTTIDCNDNSPCTSDSCQPASGCQYDKLTGLNCQDGDACTTGDVCLAGLCVAGGTLVCSDGNLCTADSCGKDTGCSYPALTGACEDGNPCTTGESCNGGACTGGSGLSCDDANVCTTDSCDSQSGCNHTALQNACSDGNFCTVGDSCSAGACIPGGQALTCADNAVCTSDYCDPQSGCVYAANSLPCNDGDACTANDTCAGGQCVSGTPCKKCTTAADCSDGNSCTTDTCSAETGCANPNTPGSCDDGSVCTTTDACTEGTCIGGGSLNCNDNNSCTIDSCDPIAGCLQQNQLGQSCGSEKVCNSQAQCTCPGGESSLNCGGYLNDITLTVGQLIPPFAPDITDYVVLPTTATSVGITVDAPVLNSLFGKLAGTQFGLSSGIESKRALLYAGTQSLTVTAMRSAGSKTYTIRWFTPNLVQPMGDEQRQSPNFGADKYGYAVSLDGNYVAVGAPEEDGDGNGVGADPTDNSALNAGAVWVGQVANKLAAQTYIKAPASTAGAGFGSAVALCDEMLVVGAPFANSGKGQVSTYKVSGGTWSHFRTFALTDAAAGDNFGAAVACVDNATDEIAIGVPGMDRPPGSSETLLADSGGAYIVKVTSSAATFTWFLRPPGIAAGNQFGWALATVPGFVFVGAPGTNLMVGDNTVIRAGVVWSYQLTSDSISNLGTLQGLGHFDELFGAALAADVGRLVVGAPGDSTGGSGFAPDTVPGIAAQSGAAYAFVLGTQGPVSTSGVRWKAPVPAAQDMFGVAVATHGLVTAVGASGRDGALSGLSTSEAVAVTPQNTGLAYLYAGADVQAGTSSWSVTGMLGAPTPGANAAFSFALALKDDVLVAGAPLMNLPTAGADEGMVSVVDLRKACSSGASCLDTNPCTSTTCLSTGLCDRFVAATATCSDGDSCTIDTCQPDSSCLSLPSPEGTSCPSGLCATGATCQAGQCTGAVPKDCDDNLACTTDSCTAGTGVCVHSAGIETCNGLDDDCDGQTDEPASLGDLNFMAGSSWYYLDQDSDGVGQGTTPADLGRSLMIHEVKPGVLRSTTTSAGQVELLILDDLPAMALDGLYVGDSVSPYTSKAAAVRVNIAGTVLDGALLRAGTLLVLTGGSSSSTADLSYNPVAGPEADWNLTLSFHHGLLSSTFGTVTFSSTGDVVWVGLALSGTETVDSWAFGTTAQAASFGSLSRILFPANTSGTAVARFFGDEWALSDAVSYGWVSSGNLTMGDSHGGDNTTFVDSRRSSVPPGLFLCGPTPPYTASSYGDCNDDANDISPLVPESCNGADDNCNEFVDEGCP